MLNIPEKDRSCKVLLTEGKLRPARLWRWSTHNRSRDPYPRVKDFLSYIWIRRSFEILQYTMKFLSPISDNERRVAVISMASARLNMPNSADAFKRLREELSKKRAASKKKQAAEQATEVAGGHVYTSSPEASPKKKRPRKDPAADKGKKVAEATAKKQVAVTRPDSSKALSPNLSSFDEPTSFLDKSFDYILPADEKHLQKKKIEDVFDTAFLSAFHVSCLLYFVFEFYDVVLFMITFVAVQSLQTSLHLHGRYRGLSDKYGKQRKLIEVMKQEKAKVDSAAEELKGKNSTLEKELEDMRAERDRQSLELAEARAALVEEQRLVAGLKDQVMNVASVAMCKAKAELYREYLAGDHRNWNRDEMQEMVEACEEMCRLEELSPGQNEEQVLDENQLSQGVGAGDNPLNDLPVVDPSLADATNVNQPPADDTTRLDPPVN
jgi:hypothetical protein